MFQFEIHSKSILQLCNSDTYSKLSMLKRTSNWIMSGNPANSPTLLWIGLMQKHAMCIFARSKFRRLGSMPQSFLPPHTHRRQTFPQHQWQSCKHPCTSKAMSDMWSCIFKWLNRQMSASSFILLQPQSCTQLCICSKHHTESFPWPSRTRFAACIQLLPTCLHHNKQLFVQT